MENDTRSGINRTGIQMAPRQGPNQVEFAQARPASPEEGGARSLADARAEYIRAATRVGSVPLPGGANESVGRESLPDFFTTWQDWWKRLR